MSFTALVFTFFRALLLSLPLKSVFLLSRRSLCLALLELGPLLSFGDLSLLAGNQFLHGLEFGPLLVALSTLCGDLDSILHIGTRSLGALSLGSLCANLCSAQLADLIFDWPDVDEVLEYGFRILIDTRAVEGAIDKSDSLATVQCEELYGIALDFGFSDLEYGPLDLVAMFLQSI